MSVCEVHSYNKDGSMRYVHDDDQPVSRQYRSSVPRGPGDIPAIRHSFNWMTADRPTTARLTGPHQHFKRLAVLDRTNDLIQQRRAVAYRASKRFFDLVLASVLLIILFPVFILVALAIELESPGPAVYVQRRAGYRGRTVFMLKFRTMRADRRVRCSPIKFPDRRRTLKVSNDPRITRVGRFLRRTSVDELPQLVNILCGEMTFVGPRPELPELVAHYRQPHYLRHSVTPGMTGWWQINGRCSRPDGCPPQEDLEGKLADDLFYLEHRSLGFDLKILLLTVPVLLRGRGAR
jgi:lipopolysaccharide/colanic/teichoic acid biosynthesis glycosyltransferase